MMNSSYIKGLKRLFSFIIPLLFAKYGKAQTISGKIYNANKESLVGAYITVPSINGVGAISDENGAFSLKVNTFPVTLKVSYLGYQENQVVVKFGRAEDEQALKVWNNLMVQGYDTERNTKVEPMTLKGFIREMIENGKELPMETFGVFVGHKINIKKG